MEPEVRFCTSADGTRLSYVCWGDGPGMPLVEVNSWLVTSESSWDQAGFRHLSESLGRGRRLINIDRRGTGGSQRDVDDLSLEAQVADLAAVVDHAGLDQFDLVGWVDGGAVAVAYSAQHPERVGRLVLNTLYPRGQDGWRFETTRSLIELMRTDWPLACRTLADLMYPDAPVERRRGQANALRSAVSPEAAAQHFEFMTGFDVSSFLPRLQAQTLVFLHRHSEATMSVSRAAAAQIPNARFVAMEGVGPLADERETATLIRKFLDEGRVEHPSIEAGGLVTILFTDLASSTALTQRLGDAKAQELVRAHNTIVREALHARGGSEIKHTGDGIMASFPTASGALECAVAIQRAVVGQGDVLLAVHAGLNAGEPVAEESDLFGTAVQLARRISDHAQAGEVLVSNVVRELAAGKDFLFADRGEAPLRGFEDPVRLYELRWRENG